MTTSAETAQRAREGSACYCCGAPHPEADLVRLSCHFEVGLCRHCLGWLNLDPPVSFPESVGLVL